MLDIFMITIRYKLNCQENQKVADVNSTSVDKFSAQDDGHLVYWVARLVRLGELWKALPSTYCVRPRSGRGLHNGPVCTVDAVCTMCLCSVRLGWVRTLCRSDM
jgi:hypothetical protein